MRFRVRNMADSKRTNPAQAYVLVLAKYAFGITYFLTMAVRPDRRAIHDLAAGSIAVEATAVRPREGLQSDRHRKPSNSAKASPHGGLSFSQSPAGA